MQDKMHLSSTSEGDKFQTFDTLTENTENK